MTTIRCPQCNLVNFLTAISCKRCGYFFQEVNSEPAETPPAKPAPGGANQSSFSPPSSVAQQFSSPPHPPNYQTANYSNYRPNYQGSSPRIKLAVISLILGILSFPILNTMVGMIFGVVLALIFGTPGFVVGMLITLAFLPAGLITGITALVKAKKRPNEYGGKGLAIAGIVLSGVGFLILPIIAAIAVPNMLAARKSANEASAISSLRTLAAAEETYLGMRAGRICGDLADLRQTQLIDSVLAGGTKNGYVFMVAKLPLGCELHAKPVNASGASATGIRSFYYSTEDRLFRAANKNGQLADKSDPPME